nr:histidine phosphatase family protein [Roseomonas acroporae]
MLRHAPTLAAPGLCYGRLDVPPGPLPPLDGMVARLAGFGALWSSPSRRCRVLAEALGRRLGLVPVVDARLLELDFGRWEGRPWDAVPRPALDRWAADPSGFAPPGGESGAALLARVAAFASALREDGRAGIVVSHGGPLKLLRALLRDETPDLLAPAPGMGSLEIVDRNAAS